MAPFGITLNINLVIVFTIVLVIIWATIRHQFSFWKRLGINGPEPTFPFGSISEVVLRKMSMLDLSILRYREAKDKKLPFLGVYQFLSPRLIVIDPKLIKRIFVKDFEYFQNRALYYNENSEVITASIMALEDDRWKNLRTKMTPVFSTGKLKSMFGILFDVTEKLNKYLEKPICSGDEIDINDLISRCTIDIIGNVAFGIECDSLKDPTVPFYVNAKKTLDWNTVDFIRTFVASAYPNFYRKTGLTFFPKGSSEVFSKLCKEVIDFRREKGIVRNDILQALIELMDGPAKISFNDVLAQSFVFFFAGFETSATAVSFAMYELSYNQKIQENLRSEIKKSIEKHGGLNYEAIMDIPLLQQVVDETLRKYPPVYNLSRKVGKPYNIPGTDIVLPKGLQLILPIYAVQNDPEYFANPGEFNPDRFSAENKTKINPDSYYPFGEGPRICIGMRFAQISSKLILAQLISKNRFSLSPNMNPKITPVERHITLYCKEKILLIAEKV